MTEAATAVIDRQDALSRIGDDEALLQTLVDMFLAGYDDYVRNIDEPFAAADWRGFTRGAHTLKGVLATLSAHRAHGKALALEEAAKEQDGTASQRLIDELKQELGVLLRELGP